MSEEPAGEGSCPSDATWGTSPHLSAREWLLLMVLAAVQFNHIVDFMIIMPLGPVYQREMGISVSEFAGLVAAYTISAAIANLLAALCIDRFDRKTALLTAFAGFTAGTFLCAIAPDYPLLLAARCIAGAFGGVSAGLIMTIIGDVFHDRRRGTATGVVMSAFSVATSLGLPLGLYLADELTWQAPFLVLSGISAGVLLLAACVLPSMRGHLTPADGQAITIAERLTGFMTVLADANHLRAFALMMAMMFTGFLTGTVLAMFLEYNVGLHQHDLKFIYLCGGIATIVTMTPVGWLADRFGKLRLFRMLALSTMVPVMLITILPNGTGLWLVLILTTLQIITMSGRMVPAMAMITGSAAPGQRGSFMSMNTAVQHMSAGLAQLAGGALISQPVTGGPLVGFQLVALISCAATLASVYLAGRLVRSPGGELAPDALDTPGDEQSEPVDIVDGRHVMQNNSVRKQAAYKEIVPTSPP
jgi:DHA1 family inner membrane transport protein